MNIGEALRDAIVTVQGDLAEAIREAVAIDPTSNPADDQAVQWYQGHITTWRLALGDERQAIIDDYDAAVVRVMTELTAPGEPVFG